MTGGVLAWHQFTFDARVFWRSPASVFFTVMLPLIFLFIFTGLFGSETIDEYGGIKVSTYYVPGIITLSVASATLQSLAINLTEARESGRLKRIRATPLPPWAFVAGRVGNAFVISILMTVLVTLIGHFFFDVAIPTRTIPALLVTLVVGAFTFSCLGFALTAAIPSQDAAPPIANVTLLPALLPLGRLHPGQPDPGRGAGLRRPLPDPPLLPRVLRGLRPGHRRRRVRLGRPGGAGALGTSRTGARGAVLPLDATQVDSAT